MGHQLRYMKKPNALIEVTTRTIQGRLLLRPSKELNKIIHQLTTALVTIDNQNRRMAVDYDKRMQTLHDRLLQLLNMRDQLGPHYGDSEDTA